MHPQFSYFIFAPLITGLTDLINRAIFLPAEFPLLCHEKPIGHHTSQPSPKLTNRQIEDTVKEINASLSPKELFPSMENMAPKMILLPTQQRRSDVRVRPNQKNSPLVIEYQTARRIMNITGVNKSRIPAALYGALSKMPSDKIEGPSKKTYSPNATGTISVARAAAVDARKNLGLWPL